MLMQLTNLKPQLSLPRASHHALRIFICLLLTNLLQIQLGRAQTQYNPLAGASSQVQQVFDVMGPFYTQICGGSNGSQFCQQLHRFGELTVNSPTPLASPAEQRLVQAMASYLRGCSTTSASCQQSLAQIASLLTTALSDAESKAQGAPATPAGCSGASTAGRAGTRVSSAASLTAGGVQTACFCTRHVQITVVHTCDGAGPLLGGSGTSSYCSWGQTLLTGPRTYRLGSGNTNIVPGCYQQMFANTSVGGAATAISTIWYTP